MCSSLEQQFTANLGDMQVGRVDWRCRLTDDLFRLPLPQMKIVRPTLKHPVKDFDSLLKPSMLCQPFHFFFRVYIPKLDNFLK